MRRKLEKRKLFNKELDINDFSIPEFVKWMTTIDLSDYIKVTKVPIDDTFDYANIIVIDNDGVVVKGALVTIDDIDNNNRTNNFGQCNIDEIPANEQHKVTITMDGYQQFSQYYSAQDIISLVIVLDSIEESQPEESSEEEQTRTVTINIIDENNTPIQGATVSIGSNQYEEVYQGETNEIGLCVIENVPINETYVITIEAEGYITNVDNYSILESILTIVLQKETQNSPNINGPTFEETEE